MTSREELKRIACARIEAGRRELIDLARAVLDSPETGFMEENTSRLVRQKLDAMGVRYQAGLALTGIRGEVPCGKPGPAVAVLGELDSLKVPGHPHADPATGAAHACGHHAQLAMLLGTVAGLLVPEVRSALSGAIVPMAVPAEEFIEVERRLALRGQGRIEFMGGKQEFLRLGLFHGVDVAMMCHTASTAPGDSRCFFLGGTSNGHVVKYVEFMGRAAHAGAAPHAGVNALNAAMLALSAIHANRETFREQDTVRVHGIVTRGGEAVNAVPADVRLEWRVRAGTLQALVASADKVDRCFKAGALGVGARVRITNIPGYLPLRNDPGLSEVFRANAEALVGRERVAVHTPDYNRGGSTDMGDVSQVVPSIHPYVGGAVGTGHGADYVITDYERAVISPAKAMVMTVIDLLADGARGAREVVAGARPEMALDQYLRFQRDRAGVMEYDGAAS